MLDVRLLRDRVVAGGALAGFVVSFAMFGVLGYLGLYLQAVLGYSAAFAGVASLPSTGMIVFAAPVASRMAARWGARVPLAIGLTLCAAGVGSLMLAGAGSTYADFWWSLPLIGTGMGLSFSPITIAVMERVNVAKAGMASATTNATRELGGVAGIAVMGSVITARLAAALPDRLAAIGVHSAAAARGRRRHRGWRGWPRALARGAACPWSTVAESFTDGLHLALGVATLVLLVGGAVVWRLLGSRSAT